MLTRGHAEICDRVKQVNEMCYPHSNLYFSFVFVNVIKLYCHCRFETIIY